MSDSIAKVDRKSSKIPDVSFAHSDGVLAKEEVGDGGETTMILSKLASIGDRFLLTLRYQSEKVGKGVARVAIKLRV